MSISDLSCDLCGRLVSGPAAGIRFVYHPGALELRDNSGLACVWCWDAAMAGMQVAAGRCAACGVPVTRQQSLHVRRLDEPGSWLQLCARHAVAFLNALGTVEPKLDVATFRFPAAGSGAAGHADG